MFRAKKVGLLPIITPSNRKEVRRVAFAFSGGAAVGELGYGIFRSDLPAAMTLLVGAILTMGRRTVTGVLWTVRAIAPGHFSSYHRVFSRAS